MRWRSVGFLSGLLLGPLLAFSEAPQAQPLLRYAERLFARPGFRRSLSEAELALRESLP